MDNYAIQVQHVSKMYKLYDNPNDRLKESLGLTRKKLYKEHYALNNVDFDIKTGETVGIIGTNGSGKSTILKIITGLLNPTEGNVQINGRISALLELGAGFNMEYTGIENVYLNGTMIGFSRDEIDKKLDDILEFADIGDFVYQPVKTYSSGMFVRLAFAVAINIEPEILIVDEALSVGDVFFQAKCFRKFEEFKKMGKTILIVSHDLGSISKYCDKVILLNQGQKLAEGAPKEIIDMYKKLLVNQLNVDDIIKAQSENNVLEVTTEVKEPEEEELHSTDQGLWKDYLQLNPYVNEYGNKRAEIIDFAVIDQNGTVTSSIEKGTKFKIRSKVKFNDKIQDPIFTYTFKDIHGTSITGTNSMYEKVQSGIAEKDDVFVCTFEQEMTLQGGEYLLSISCTGYGDGDFVVYHRMYDAINITVISDKNTVGYYDMNSQVKVQKL